MNMWEGPSRGRGGPNRGRSGQPGGRGGRGGRGGWRGHGGREEFRDPRAAESMQRFFERDNRMKAEQAAENAKKDGGN